MLEVASTIIIQNYDNLEFDLACNYILDDNSKLQRAMRDYRCFANQKKQAML